MSDHPPAGKPVVGFVGVGNMGWPMAECLARAGFTLNINDSRREVANNFVQQIGGTAPDTLRALAAGSDVIVTMLPATQFSGMLQPVATLEGGAWLFGTLFPTTHFLKVSVGAFTKGLALPELIPFILATAAFIPVFLALGVAFLPKQER